MTDITCISAGCRRPIYARNRGLCKPHHSMFLRNGKFLPSRPGAGDSWFSIPEYEGLYEASREGQIWSVRRCRLLVQSQLRDTGYLVVTLCKDKIQANLLVHRVVALTFLGPPTEEKPYVLHGDNVTTHNAVANLRYGSQAENIQQSVRDGRFSGLRENRIKFALAYVEGSAA